MKNQTTYFRLCSQGCKPYKPKPQRDRQAKLIGAGLGLVVADFILPLTFGAGCVYAKKLIKSKISYMYGRSWK